MCDEVVVTEKTEAPVDYSKENKEAWDDLLFCNGKEKPLIGKWPNLTHHPYNFDFILIILMV